MKIFDLTDTPESEFSKLLRMIDDAWFYGCITVQETGGYYEQY